MMSIIDRIMLIICSICLAILSIAVILFPFQQFEFLSKSNIDLALNIMEGNYVCSLIGLVLLLVSIRYILVSFKSN